MSVSKHEDSLSPMLLQATHRRGWRGTLMSRAPHVHKLRYSEAEMVCLVNEERKVNVDRQDLLDLLDQPFI